MTADRIADCGVRRFMTFSLSSAGKVPTNIAGMIAKYFATSLAMENVVSEPAGDQQLLADLDDLHQLRRVRVEVDHVAGFLGRRRAGVHRDADVGLRERRARRSCRRRSSRRGRRPPARCLIRAIFVSGVASARKSSTPDSCAIAAAVSGLSPVIITVRIPIFRSWANRSTRPSLMMSFSSITPRSCRSFATASGVPPARAIRSTSVVQSPGPCRARTTRRSRRPRPCGSRCPSRSTPLIRVCAVNGTNCACVSSSSRSRMPYRSFASTTIDRPSGVSSASEANCATSASSCSSTPGAGRNATAWRFPSVIVPGLVEQQRRDVAGRLDGAPAHREHVVLHQPVHPRDADRRQQAADRRRDQADEQRDQDGVRHAVARVDRERLQRDADDQEDDRELREQDRERDLVRRLLPLGALDQRDHAVQERLARVRR